MKRWKKLQAILLSIVMVMSLIPSMAVSAEDTIPAGVTEDAEPADEEEIPAEAEDENLSSETGTDTGEPAESEGGDEGTENPEEAGDLLTENDEGETDPQKGAEETTYYLTDKLEAGKNYIIASSNAAGDTFILDHEDDAAKTTAAVISSREDQLVILTASSTAVFTAASIGNGFSLMNEGYFVTVEGRGDLTFSTTASTKYWNYSNNKLSNASSSATRYLTFSDGEFKGYYSSSNPNPSDIYLFAASEGGSEDPEPVAVSGVTLDKETVSLQVGLTVKLTAAVSPANAADKSVTWASSDPSIATVADGVVTGTGVGTATITVTTTDGNKTASCEVTVTEATYDKYVLVNRLQSGGEYLIVSRNTAGEGYALTNPGGSSSGASLGSTPITVISGDVDGDEEVDLYIPADAENIIWKATANGDYFNLTNGNDYLEGKSGNVRIYSSQQYTDRGWVYTENHLKHEGGTNTYILYYSNGFTSSYNSTTETIYLFEKYVAGTEPVTGVQLDKETLDLHVGDTATLTATVEPYNAANKKVTWSSSDETVATVDENGNVTAVAAGTAVITVATADGNKTATCQVTITEIKTEKFVLTDKLEAGGEYLIVRDGTVGSADSRALKNPGGSTSGVQISATNGKTTVTVQEGNYIETADEDIVWTATENGEGFYLTNNGDYLEVYQQKLDVFKGEAKQPARYWKYEDSQLTHIGGGSPYYVTYDSGTFKSATAAPEAVIYLFKKEVSSTDPTTYTVTFNSNGGTTVDSQNIEEGKTAVKPEDPTKEGCYAFDGWYENEELTKAYNFSTPVTADITVYAKWKEAHVWGEPTYTWADDNSSVTAERVCTADPEHRETETVSASYTVVTEPTDEAAGLGRWTSEAFENAAFTIQTKDVQIPATGYVITYTWSEDNKTATAVAEPKAGGDAITETVNTVSAVTKEASCEETGTIKYTATFTNPLFTTQEKEAEIPAKGHTWDNGKVTKEPNCTEKGVRTFTCTVCQKTKTEEIEVDGTAHSWELHPIAEWNADHTSVTATFVCEHNSAHTQTVTSTEIYSVITVQPTGATPGERKYTAVVMFNGKAYEVTDTEVIPAAGLSVSGKVKSFIGRTEEGEITIRLIPEGSSEATETETVSGTQAEYGFTNVSPGKYTLEVSKKDHATRIYELDLTTGEEVIQDLEIHLMGDVNGDGRITTVDAAMTNSCAQGKYILTGYDLDVADVIESASGEKISTADAGRINSHVKGVHYLW